MKLSHDERLTFSRSFDVRVPVVFVHAKAAHSPWWGECAWVILLIRLGGGLGF